MRTNKSLAKLKAEVSAKRTYFGKYHLLGVNSDAKTSKGTKQGYLTGILYMSPGLEADGVHNMCLFASKGCLKACLNKSGRAEVFATIKAARVRKTLLFLNDNARFMALLRKDILTLIRWAKRLNMIPCVRVNGTTDIPKLALQMASEFSTVQFYDYTKFPKAWLRTRSNYYLTFSWSGENAAEVIEAQKHGLNIAVPFSGKTLPETWNGRKVIDGDKSDLRFLDEQGVIVGLRVKGTKQRKMDTAGFIQPGLIQIQPAAVAA